MQQDLQQLLQLQQIQQELQQLLYQLQLRQLLQQQQIQQELQQLLQPGNENHPSLSAVGLEIRSVMLVTEFRGKFYGQNLMFSKIVHCVKPVHCPVVMKLYFEFICASS
jgi:hypothetical protein